MDVRALRYSLAIARFGSFTRAAESLHVAQPALSVAIKKLEAELGVTLFLRKAHRVEPTVEGRILLARAERIFNEMDAAIHEIADAIELRTGVIRLGMPPMFGLEYFPSVIAQFHAAYPNISITVVEGSADEVGGLLDAGGIDIAMIESRRVRPQWKQVQVGREEMVLCVAPGHPLARRKSIAGSELDGLPMALFNGTFIQREILDKLCKRGGAKPTSCCSRIPSRSSGAPLPTASARPRSCARLPRYAAARCGFVRAEGDPALLAVLARRELPVEGESRAGRLRRQDRKDQMKMQGGTMQIATHWRAALAALALVAATAAHAAYPERPITLIVPFPPGGGTDLSARLIMPYIEKYLGNDAKIVVINKGGAGGDIGAGEIAKSKPDGYTIGFMNVPNTLMKSHERPTSWNLASFVPIANLVYDPAVFAVRPDGKYQTLAALAADAKKRPGEIPISSAGAGSNTHLDLIAFEEAPASSSCTCRTKAADSRAPRCSADTSRWSRARSATCSASSSRDSSRRLRSAAPRASRSRRISRRSSSRASRSRAGRRAD
jgi:DNA-binding transcriptional LysR family regulator